MPSKSRAAKSVMLSVPATVKLMVLAKRVAKRTAEPSGRIREAHQLALGRPATGEEVAQAREFITAYTTAADEARAWDAWCRVLLGSNEFLYVN